MILFYLLKSVPFIADHKLIIIDEIIIKY